MPSVDICLVRYPALVGCGGGPIGRTSEYNRSAWMPLGARQDVGPGNGDMMSRITAVLLVVVGGAAGAYAGLSYLSAGSECAGVGNGMVSCQLNEVYLPFLSAVTVGMAAAFAVSSLVRRMFRFLLGGEQSHNAPPALERAAEEDDPYLMLASWGLAPARHRHVERMRRFSEAVLPPGARAASWKPDISLPSHARSESSSASRVSRRRGRPVPRPRHDA